MLRSRHDREIFALALPALGTLAVDPLVTLADTAFVGQLGALPLAALGVSAAVFSVAFFLMNFLANATTPRVARLVAAGDLERAGHVLVSALATAALGSVLLVAVLQLFGGAILRAMGATETLLETALSYLRIRAWAIPGALLSLVGHGAFRGVQDAKTPLYVALALNGMNLALDPWMIFGLGWGIEGAAWATTLSQWFGGAVFVALLIARRSTFGLRWSVPSLRDLASFLRVGGGLTIRTLALLLTLTLATSVATRIGAASLAAHQVVLQVWFFSALVLDALAVSGIALVPKYKTSTDSAKARSVSNRLLSLGASGGLMLAAILFAIGPVIPSWFTSDPEVIAEIRSIWSLCVLVQPINALVFVWDGLFIGAEDIRYLALAMIASAAVASLALLLVRPLELGLRGVWGALFLLLCVRLVTMAWRYVAPTGPLTISK